jgi:hypothetical protein
MGSRVIALVADNPIAFHNLDKRRLYGFFDRVFYGGKGLLSLFVVG